MNFRLLRADEIDVRVGSVIGKNKDTVRLLLYKDARCDMSILDETVGAENWQRNHEVINGNLFCNVGIFVDKIWVWKQDVGVESNTEKEKGQASDAFKRSCTNWGIGRELYTAPSIVFFAGEFNAYGGKCTDSFKCTDIQYENNRIKSVTILAEKSHKIKTFTQDVSIIEQPEKISDTELERIEATLTEEQKAWALKKYKISTLAELTPAQYAAIFRLLQKKKEEAKNG